MGFLSSVVSGSAIHREVADNSSSLERKLSKLSELDLE